MGMFALGLERIGVVSVRWPRAALALLLAATLLAVYGVSNVRLDDELRRLFRSDSPAHQAYARMLDGFPSLENQLFLLVESDRPMGADRLEGLRGLHLDLRFVEGVDTVFSLFSLRHPPVGSEPPAPLFPAELPQGEALDRLLDQARAHPLLGDKLISPDATAALVVISLDPGRRPDLSVDDVLGAIGDLTDTVGRASGLMTTATGTLAVRSAIISSLQNDLFLLTVLGTIVATAICTLFFRRWRLVIIASLPPVAAVIWLIGAYGLAGLPITTINNVLPTLVLVIAFSDSVHLVQAVRRKMVEAVAPREAIRQAVVEVGPACAMTSITTMIACLSLASSESEPVREFAVAGALAVFCAYISVIAMIPAMSVLLLRDAGPGSVPDDLFNRLLAAASAALAAGVRRATVPIALLSIPLLVVTGYLYFRIGTDHDYRSFMVPTSPPNLAIDRINDKLGGADAVHVLIERRDGTPASPSELPAVVGAVHDAVAATPEFNNVFSEAAIARWLGSGGSPVDEGTALPERFRGQFRTADGGAFLVTAHMPATPAAMTRARLETLEAALAPVRRQYADHAVSVTGIVALGALASNRLIAGLKQSLALAVVITIAVVAMSLRSVVLALLSAIPNLLSLTIVAAGVYVIGERLQIPSVLALTIAFGIAVDNTIHLLNRYRVERRRAGVGDALAVTAEKVGPVLIAATIVLTVGMGVTMLSGLPMIRLFGSLCVVVLLTALAVALIVLPALVSFMSRRFPDL